MKLTKIEVLRGTILCESGLSISGVNSGLSIGALSSEFIKNPITKEPYIPGSSLKGKLRCILEQEKNQYGANGSGYKKPKKESEGREKKIQEHDGTPCGCGVCTICKLFGAHASGKNDRTPTRLIVRDSMLTDKSRKRIENSDFNEEVCFETKIENVIDRKKGNTINGGMRTNERVAAGTDFNFELVLQIYDVDTEKDVEAYKELIQKGLTLIELTYLGGSGSRGYGKVKFKKELKKGEEKQQSDDKISISDWKTVYPFPENTVE